MKSTIATVLSYSIGGYISLGIFVASAYGTHWMLEWIFHALNVRPIDLLCPFCSLIFN